MRKTNSFEKTKLDKTSLTRFGLKITNSNAINPN